MFDLRTFMIYECSRFTNDWALLNCAVRETTTHGRTIERDEAPKAKKIKHPPPLQPYWLIEILHWKSFQVIWESTNGVIRAIFEIEPRTLKIISFYSIFFTFPRVNILWVKVVNFKVLVTILKIALMTPFVFLLVTQNNFQKEISFSQIGCRGGC